MKWQLKPEDEEEPFYKRDFDEVKFHLVVVPTQPECFEIANLLKFAQIPYIVEEDYGRKNLKETFHFTD